MRSIAFVGAGPTTLYALKALLEAPLPDARITVFESGPEAGVGSPYRPGWNDPAMLSNIASAEIPPVTQTLLEWLQERSSSELEAMGVAPETLNDRTFVSRVALGQFFGDQFRRLVERARAAGTTIDVCTGCQVVDVVNQAHGVALSWVGETPRSRTAIFDHVVLATGHQWPWRQEASPGYFTSPWPAATLTELPPTAIGIRGSSLTAIDAAIALARSHGAFVPRPQGFDYESAPGTEALHITLMSRKGLLPEADFYFPLPHPPLEICTPAAIRQLIRDGADGLLDRAFDLFRAELQTVDPDYVAATGLTDAGLEAFGEAAFETRASTDPFVWAAANLGEARANHAAKITVPWRDALLRMHEVIATIAPHLNDTDFDRFTRHWKPVFVDAYGAVPHDSIERLLALHRAGKLEVLALGDSYTLETRPKEEGARLIVGGAVRQFPVFIEATGQKALGAIQFPFLSLIEQGVVRDAASDQSDGLIRGIEVNDHFALVADGLPANRLFCVSLPFILGRKPFAQGITSSHDMGGTVGRCLARVVASAPVDTPRAVA